MYLVTCFSWSKSHVAVSVEDVCPTSLSCTSELWLPSVVSSYWSFSSDLNCILHSFLESAYSILLMLSFSSSLVVVSGFLVFDADIFSLRITSFRNSSCLIFLYIKVKEGRSVSVVTIFVHWSNFGHRQHISCNNQDLKPSIGLQDKKFGNSIFNQGSNVTSSE